MLRVTFNKYNYNTNLKNKNTYNCKYWIHRLYFSHLQTAVHVALQIHTHAFWGQAFECVKGAES